MEEYFTNKFYTAVQANCCLATFTVIMPYQKPESLIGFRSLQNMG